MWTRLKITRDAIIVSVALGLGIYEVILRVDVRPSVLTFCIALLASPIVARVDDRLSRKRQQSDSSIE